MDSPSKVSPSPSQSEIMDVEEILNCNFEYEPLDLPTAVPLFYQSNVLLFFINMNIF